MTDLFKTIPQVFLARMNQISVVHIASVTAYAQFFLDEVVKLVCAGQRQNLTDLTAKSQTDLAESIHKIFCQTNELFIRQFLLKNFPNHLMGDAVKELAEIEQQNVAVHSVLTIMPAKMNAKSSNSEVIPLVLDGCTIIVNKGSAQNRHQ